MFIWYICLTCFPQITVKLTSVRSLCASLERFPLMMLLNVPVYSPTLPTDEDYSANHVPLYFDKRRNCTVCYQLSKLQSKCHFTCKSSLCKGFYFCLNSTRNCFKQWHGPEFNGKRGKPH